MKSGSEQPRVEFDEIGYWSEIKHKIIQKYAVAYSRILAKQRLEHVYIGGFSGSGLNRLRRTGKLAPGSPRIALSVEPPFEHYYFIDMDGGKLDVLRKLTAGREDVSLFEGDANRILIHDVLPEITYEKFMRGLCLLDPYGLDLDWEVIHTIGQGRVIEMFLNFPIMDINRNALWLDPTEIPERGLARMTRLWGDESWRQAAYSAQGNLFGAEPELVKKSNQHVVDAFRTRLKESAGFACVPAPIPMRNSTGSVVYYLFFASGNSTGARIVAEIFDSYRNHGRIGNG